MKVLWIGDMKTPSQGALAHNAWGQLRKKKKKKKRAFELCLFLWSPADSDTIQRLINLEGEKKNKGHDWRLWIVPDLWYHAQACSAWRRESSGSMPSVDGKFPMVMRINCSITTTTKIAKTLRNAVCIPVQQRKRRSPGVNGFRGWGTQKRCR